MNENISRKIKITAKILGLIGILGFVYFVYAVIASGGEPIFIGICAFFALLFILSFPIYGMGELIDEAKIISKALKGKESQSIEEKEKK